MWLGKFLDKMDELDMWKDTTVILTTDHGHLLGEHGYWAKNYMFVYNELAHIPLIIWAPGAQNNGKRVEALTTTIDLMPTLMELYGATPSCHVQGKSLVHLLEKDEPHHDAVLYGYFGKDINLTDGKYTYCRQPLEGSVTYRHTAMPVAAKVNPALFAKAEMGKFLKQTDMPVYRAAVPSHKHHNAPECNLLYNIEKDPGQTVPIFDETLEKQYADKMRELLQRYDAPECQYVRTGLIRPD